MCPKLFDKQYLGAEFEKLDKVMEEHVNLYLIGGGSMSFQGYKAATKDIDVVVRSNDELDKIVTALRSTGYLIPAIRGPYKQMSANAILENTDDFRWDIFVNVICDGLQLSDGMIKRSQELFRLENVCVKMISPEDIFIFKSITTRERDLEDMYTLFTKGLDFNIIKDEIFWQNKNKVTDFAWVSFIFDGLEDFMDHYHISHPIMDELHDLAYNDMLTSMILNKLKSGPLKIEQISTDIDIEDVSDLLNLLIMQGHLVQKKSGEYSLVKK